MAAADPSETVIIARQRRARKWKDHILLVLLVFVPIWFLLGLFFTTVVCKDT